MALMEQLIEALNKLPEGSDDLKTSIKGIFQAVNQEAGKAKTDLESYKKGDSEYKKLQKKFKDAGFTEDQFEELAEERGVRKTIQDELEIQQSLYKEALKQKRDLEAQVKLNKMENVVGRKAEELAKAYKTADGKTVKISERFIDKKELFKDIDLESDLIVQDRVQRVMNAAFESQSAFMKELGIDFQGQPVHKVPVGESILGSGKVLVDTALVKSVLDTNHGSIDAAAQALTMYEQAS